MEKLLTTGDTGDTAVSGQKWQTNTYYGAMTQLAIDLDPTLMIINDAVHSR